MVLLLPLPALADIGSEPTQSPTLLVTGDSLSAAYGMTLDQGWVALLQRRLSEQGYPHKVVNTSVSGETTRGALARLPSELARHQPGIVLIELGANDGLRGLPVQTMRENLKKMIGLSKKAGARVLLFEMRIPENYGQAYTKAFSGSYKTVATQEQVTLLPFFMAPIALQPGSFQSDGIHPTAAAQPLLLEAVWPGLRALLK